MRRSSSCSERSSVSAGRRSGRAEWRQERRERRSRPARPTQRRRPSRRGQTEPLGALVAIIVVILAITLYAGFLTDSLPGVSERTVEEPTIDRVWHELETDGVYDRDDDPQREIDPETLPGGYDVYVEITVINDDGREEVVGTAQFRADGSDGTGGPPDDARASSRPVPVEYEPGDVRGGTLTVEVWS